MKLAVCIKQVPSSSEVSVDPVTHNLIREKSGTMMNPSDLNALEMALGIKEENQGVCETAAITMGPPGAQEELRTAMAMGIDRGCLLTDRCLAGGDTIATARALAKGLSRLGTYDLILAGAESSDGATGQVGPMLAEAMGLPHVSSVQRIEKVSEGEIQVLKKFHQSAVRLRVKLPAVVTVVYGCNDPRLPPLRSKMAAKKKEIVVYTNEELQIPKELAGLQGSPTMVTESFLPERVQTENFLTGNAREIAQKILELVEKERGNT